MSSDLEIPRYNLRSQKKARHTAQPTTPRRKPPVKKHLKLHSSQPAQHSYHLRSQTKSDNISSSGNNLSDQGVTSISQPVDCTEHGFSEKTLTKVDSPVLINESTESIISDHTNVNFITNIPPPNTPPPIQPFHNTTSTILTQPIFSSSSPALSPLLDHTNVNFISSMPLPNTPPPISPLHNNTTPILAEQFFSPTIPTLSPQYLTPPTNHREISVGKKLPQLSPHHTIASSGTSPRYIQSPSNYNAHSFLVTPDQWPTLKNTFFHIRDLTIKIIKQQTHVIFLRHCIRHKAVPKGMNLDPNIPSFVKNNKLISRWYENISNLGFKLVKIVIKSLNASIKEFRNTLNSEILNLKTISSEQNFNSMYKQISKVSNKTFHQQVKTKNKKSFKLLNCCSVTFQHSDIFTVKSKQKCPKSPNNLRKNRRFRHPFSPPEKKTVVNLSQHFTPTACQTNLLEKSLKFCPVPHILDKTETSADTNHFTAKMRRHKYHFDNQPANFNTSIGNPPTPTSSNPSTKDSKISRPNMLKFGIKSQAIPSAWIPEAGVNQHLDEFCASITNHIALIPQRTDKDNLSPDERTALKDFIKNINKDIVIRPADKGGALVIQDRADYISACDSLLSDENFYKPLHYDPTQEISKKLSVLLKSLISVFRLENLIFIQDLQNRFPVAGRFYTLPKIHKPGSPPPGRPIVSGNGSVTEIISSFVDYFLKDLVPSLDSYIQDTTDFLRKLDALGPLPDNSVIFTLDVTSLYTNIPHTDGLAAAEKYLNRRESQEIPTQFLIKLMDFVLKNNNFCFNGQNFIQTQGTAMGTKMAPSYACLFMGDLERGILENSPDKPFLWVRFIDDIFGIWTHGMEKWHIFYEHLNSSHNHIKFVGSVSDTCIPFLDVEVHLDNGLISTDLYCKPTNSHNYLPWNSCHPKGTKKGIPYSQALRIRRICSEPHYFNKRLYQLGGYLRSCNYPPKYINTAFALVRSMPRSSALEYRQDQRNTRITFPITFHPNLRNLPQVLLEKYTNILLRDPNNKYTFKEPPMLAYRRPPNLRSLITRASITRQSDTHVPGFYDCSNTDCTIHTHNFTGNTFTSSVTKKTYRMIQTLDCNSHNIIYLVTCTKPDCKQQYVGETGRKHKDRCPEHLRDIKNASDVPVSVHFRLPGHTAKNFSVQVIEHCRKENTPFRKSREWYWQRILKPQINIIHCSNTRRTSKPKPRKSVTFKTRPKGKNFKGTKGK